MSRNGSGTYSLPAGNPVVTGTTISSSTMNTTLSDIATALTGSLAADGQTTVTGDQAMAGYKHTGVGDATARTGYASAGQVQDGKLNWVDGGGTADAITATYSPAVTALVDGQVCFVRATAANATTTPTFAPNGLTAHTIVKAGGQALTVGDIYGDGHELILKYDLTNTRWEFLNPAVQQIGLVGGVRNSKCSITSASATATFTADEVVCKTALGGKAFVAGSFSQAVDLSTTGAGAMDTGAAPASGFVSVYAIMKADGTKNALACNITTSSGEVYGGANMPSGYVASALLAVIPTNGSSQFIAGLLMGRKLYLQSKQNALNLTSSVATTYTSASISSIVPSITKSIDGLMGSPASGNVPRFSIAADANGLGQKSAYLGNNNSTIDGFYQVCPFEDLPILTAQTIYYKSADSSAQIKVDITAYSF